MGGILLWMIIGLAAGVLSWFFVPGEDRLGLTGTIGLGLIGSTVGGLLSVVISDNSMTQYSSGGLIGALIGAVVVVGLVWGINHETSSTEDS